MREIVLDIETTGLNFEEDRVFEVGCIELFDKVPTGNELQIYINPNKSLSEDATRITGYTDSQLVNYPPFRDIVDSLLKFLHIDPIIAHNANFDITFINQELTRLGMPKLTNPIIDSLEIARKLFPGKKNNLDALCKRLKVDSSQRVVHGALLDSYLTAQVYYIMSHISGDNDSTILANKQDENKSMTTFPVRIFSPTPAEMELHNNIVKRFGLSVG